MKIYKGEMKIFVALLLPVLAHGFAFQTSKPSLVSTTSSTLRAIPPELCEITEVACQEAANKMEFADVKVPDFVSPTGQVNLSYIHWEPKTKAKNTVPLVMVHGFDSSCLEYRRLGPKLAELGIDTYAVDLLGWGYTQLNDVNSFSAEAKVAALESWWKTVGFKNQKVCIAGASLGGAAAIEFATLNDTLACGVILIDAQGFVDGVGPMAKLPKPIAELGVRVLKSVPLRNSANQMSYFDKQQYATEDALKVGRLHCLRDGWNNALVNFMLSGGFSPSTKVPKIDQPTLILWGRQDGILEPEYAQQFINQIQNSQLKWIEECGHVPHLEQPAETAQVIADFLKGDQMLTNNNNKQQQPVVLWGSIAVAAAAIGEAVNVAVTN